MLIVRPKIAELNFMLFGRSIHPELFDSCAKRRIERENYSLDLNITSDGHLIVFRHGKLTLAEISAGHLRSLPEKRILLKHPIKHQCSDELTFRDLIGYQCEFQRETVTAKTVLSIQQQLSDAECEGLVHRFEASGRIAFGAISYINVQAYQHHVLIRTVHTFPDACSIVSSNSVFRVHADRS